MFLETEQKAFPKAFPIEIMLNCVLSSLALEQVLCFLPFLFTGKPHPQPVAPRGRCDVPERRGAAARCPLPMGTALVRVARWLPDRTERQREPWRWRELSLSRLSPVLPRGARHERRRPLRRHCGFCAFFQSLKHLIFHHSSIKSLFSLVVITLFFFFSFVHPIVVCSAC